MIVQVGDKKYSVRFQYAPPQITHDKKGKVVKIDNSNRSTLCEFKQIEPQEGPPFFGTTSTDRRGRDQFDRKAGRRIALERALIKYALGNSMLADDEHMFVRKVKQVVYSKMQHGEVKPNIM